MKDIVFERFGAMHLAANLAAAGLPARVESKNAKVFTPPAKDLEARIKARQLRHTGSSFLTWQVSNVCVERRRDGSLLPTKDAADVAEQDRRGRRDPAGALGDAGDADDAGL